MSKSAPFLIVAAIVLSSASAFAIKGEETEGMSGMSAEDRQKLAKPTPYQKPAPAKAAKDAPKAAKTAAAKPADPAAGERKVSIKGEETEGMSGMTAEERGKYRALKK